ncbi:sensor histidine kinase [Lederbergia lenta]|uniref:histidine kinase n=1 Tax=Lederbergia lenta TaxID=1467 RepID=A0A2X4VSB2_LEDLE|nr:sensor histidine kinase [Lederbergia lenta]MEC2326579.1 sensor histidine kinase [Lederbergia lenta]SQI53139.1 two-component sensor histidine kinase YesM [Lederbergia lenta]
MRSALARLKDSYNNQTIKKKLFILVSIIMVISFTFALAGLQYVLRIYDEQIYSKSSQVLSTSSNSIENELKNIEDMSFAISSDPLIQHFLTTIEQESTEYEKYRIRTEMIDKMLDYIKTQGFILSVHVVATNGEQYSVGTNPVNIPEKVQAMIINQSKEAAGSNIWLNQLGDHLSLVSAREIRRYEDLSFDSLGTVIIRVNLDKLVRGLMEGSKALDGHFVITNGENDIMYPRELNDTFRRLTMPVHSKSGYRIETIDKRKYFIVHMQSNYSNWTYLNAIPFNQIFEKTNMLKTFLWMFFILMFLVVSFFGIRFARNITLPLESLAASMQHVQKGNFKEAKKESMQMSNVHNDEVGKLHKSFIMMIDQIDELIYENYAKQITIKETEFKALQAQINPHFLYNTLESINWLAKSSGQQQISKMVESLGFLLRNSINLKQPLITVNEELQIIANYITIQSYRFEERLEFQNDVDQSLYHAQIPKLTLQPLVENAIHYGLEMMMEPCSIHIRSIKKSNYFMLVVEDNGPGMDLDLLEKVKKGVVKTRGQGIGLTNIDERVKLSFGDQYGIHIESELDQGTKIFITLPYREG